MTREPLGRDAGAIRALGARLVAPGLIVFPVRHHSPACAWQLRRLMAESTPCEVLVEGPRSFTPLAPLLAHPAAKMPLAVYTYSVRRGGADDPEVRRAAYYPFCDYSPELVALREAAARAIPVRFIDLDFAEQCQLEPTDAQDDGEAGSLLDERHYRRSAQLQALAERLGCRDHEELWEHLFELDPAASSLSEHVARVAAYCQLCREDSSDAELAADGTLAREAEMAFHIREAMARRAPDAGPVLAVVGGFHAVVLPGLVASDTPRPAVRVPAASEQASALIRYGFERLDRLNGYSAGMTSPAWHQMLWEQMLRPAKPGEPAAARTRGAAALSVLADIAFELRARHAVALPMPTLAAAYEQALRLAHLRGRPAPLRHDVLDAVTSCFVKGDADADGAIVLQVARRALCGVAMGTVPPGASTPPLVRDFAWRARRQRLKIDDSEPRKLVLQLYRRPAHRLTSRLLHSLALLGVPFASRQSGPDFAAGVGLDRLQEHWHYGYSAATEAALVEASVYGVTVPLAAANRFAARLDAMQAEGNGQSAAEGARMLTQACVLGLHDHLPRVLALLRRAVGEDAAFDSVVGAAANLGLLWESREPLEARQLDELPALLQAAYERATFLGRELRGRQCDPPVAVQALSQLRELLVSEAGRALDPAMYWDMVDDLQAHHDAALVRGAATGLRYCAGRLDDAALGATLDGHFRGMLRPAEAVAFLRGLLSTAREVAWQQPALMGVLDALVRAWSEEDFVANLPELRLAFAGMTPKETDRIAEAVAALNGVGDLGPLVHRDLDARQVQQHLAAAAALAEVLAGDGLSDWVAA
jgi:hypothetical protein